MSQTASPHKKLILVIGATGAQGIAVIDALLAPSQEGSPSPYAIRALTRDPESQRARELTKKGVECFKGSFDDLKAVAAALQGVYGAFVNTDSFTVGEQKEVYLGMRIFELAKQVPTLRHYVWSNLEYIAKIVNYNPLYRCEHYDGKGRVGEWMHQQPSEPTSTGMSWSLLTTGPYMDTLFLPTFGPITKRPDGTHVFLTPIEQGHVPAITLADLGFFARYIFDHQHETSGQDLSVASEVFNWDTLVSTFQNVTGEKAEIVRVGIDEFWGYWTDVDRPVASEKRRGDGSTTWRENFSAWLALYRDDVIKKDMEWVRRVNPGTRSLEQWMRENNYTGTLQGGLLKNLEEGRGPSVNLEKVSKL